MTKVLVAIPWRPQPHRLYAFDKVYDWYKTLFPHSVVVPIDTGHEPFCLAACRNRGVQFAEDTDAGVVILADADTLPEPDPLYAAVEACTTSGLVHLPYTEYRSLRQDGTDQYLTGTPLPDCNHLTVPYATSGVYVTTPQAWWASGGQDEMFLGWAPEDMAWLISHRLLLGAEPVRHEGRVYALHHDSPPKTGTAYDAAVKRYQRYLEAGDAGDVATIRALVHESGHAESRVS